MWEVKEGLGYVKRKEKKREGKAGKHGGGHGRQFAFTKTQEFNPSITSQKTKKQ
jgi:hypothetical protein